jgi:hypothetical protein
MPLTVFLLGPGIYIVKIAKDKIEVGQKNIID